MATDATPVVAQVQPEPASTTVPKQQPVVVKSKQNRTGTIDPALRLGKYVIFLPLADSVTEGEVWKLARTIGEVAEVEIEKKGVSASERIAIVLYNEPSCALRAQEDLTGSSLGGTFVRVIPCTYSTTLYILDVPLNWGAAELAPHVLNKAGGLLRWETVKDVQHGNQANRGFARVMFSSQAEARAAFKAWTSGAGGIDIDEQKATVLPADQMPFEQAVAHARVKAVHVGNIDWGTTEQSLDEVFSSYGKIEKIVLGRNVTSANRKDFAIVNYALRADARKAVKAMHDVVVSGRRLDVSLANPPGQKGSGGPMALIQGAAAQQLPHGAGRGGAVGGGMAMGPGIRMGGGSYSGIQSTMGMSRQNAPTPRGVPPINMRGFAGPVEGNMNGGGGPRGPGMGFNTPPRPAAGIGVGSFARFGGGVGGGCGGGPLLPLGASSAGMGEVPPPYMAGGGGVGSLSGAGQPPATNHPFPSNPLQAPATIDVVGGAGGVIGSGPSQMGGLGGLGASGSLKNAGMGFGGSGTSRVGGLGRIGGQPVALKHAGMGVGEGYAGGVAASQPPHDMNSQASMSLNSGPDMQAAGAAGVGASGGTLRGGMMRGRGAMEGPQAFGSAIGPGDNTPIGPIASSVVAQGSFVPSQDRGMQSLPHQQMPAVKNPAQMYPGMRRDMQGNQARPGGAVPAQQQQAQRQAQQAHQAAWAAHAAYMEQYNTALAAYQGAVAAGDGGVATMAAAAATAAAAQGGGTVEGQEGSQQQQPWGNAAPVTPVDLMARQQQVGMLTNTGGARYPVAGGGMAANTAAAGQQQMMGQQMGQLMSAQDLQQQAAWNAHYGQMQAAAVSQQQLQGRNPSVVLGGAAVDYSKAAANYARGMQGSAGTGPHGGMHGH